jgi:hypothetical protein
MAREPSGIDWVERFPTSKSTETLIDGFRQKCEAFLAALQDAGASVSISATLRPPERAYLMHWSFVIDSGKVNPGDVPAHAGVEIDWVHRKPSGSPDLAASRAAATAMVQAYDIAFLPSLTSLHIFGEAIDMSIEWNDALNIKQKNGTAKTIGSLPRTGLNHDLWAIGATFGVLKLPSDPPHWSSTGH